MSQLQRGSRAVPPVLTYDANNQLLTESKTENSETVTTTYTYDANGNTLSKSTPAHGEDEASSTTYTYNGFNQLIALTVDGTSVAYAYNAQGIRTAKRVNNTRIAFLLDGGIVVAEVQNNTVTDNYLRGVNLIRRTSTDEAEYYLFNAHGLVQYVKEEGFLIFTAQIKCLVTELPENRLRHRQNLAGAIRPHRN